jgi:glycine dehydrogenase
MTQVNLGTANEFIARHIGPRAGDEQAMLNSLGFDSLEALSASVIPDSIKGTSVLGLEDGLSEADALALIKAIAGKNQLFKTFIGQGYYGTHTPRRSCATCWKTRPGTPPTRPYQPEISQGRLEALLNFQTLVSDLTGLPIANASLLDEATAAAEAMTFCKRLSKNKGSQGVLRFRALPPANHRRAAHPRRAAGHRRRGRRRA